MVPAHGEPPRIRLSQVDRVIDSGKASSALAGRGWSAVDEVRRARWMVCCRRFRVARGQINPNWLNPDSINPDSINPDSGRSFLRMSFRRTVWAAAWDVVHRLRSPRTRFWRSTHPASHQRLCHFRKRRTESSGPFDLRQKKIVKQKTIDRTSGRARR